MPVPGVITSRTGSLLLSLVAAVAILSIFPFGATAQESAPAPVTIVLKQMRYNPPDKTITPGTVVEWKNEDIFAHTVTADNGSFDSGLIAPGQSWKITVKEAGTLRYHCRPHPNMAGTLVVSAASQQKAAPSGENGGAGNQSIAFEPPTSPQQIHPILVNFTAALLPLAFLSDILGRIFRRQSLHNAAWWMILYAAAITPLTVLAGWWWKHAAGPGLPPKSITIHQWLGTSAAFLFVILALWRWRIHKQRIPPSIGYLALAFIAVLALVYQGSLGGSMVFGK
jgi:plastocyanin/uncharacterized membrane protein